MTTYQWDFKTEQEWNAKFKEWDQRDWLDWLEAHLTFPFEAIRVEGDDEARFTGWASRNPFPIGERVRVLNLVDFDPGDLYGVIVAVRRGRQTGALPLCELEVTPESDPNYGPVKEFAVYWANQ